MGALDRALMFYPRRSTRYQRLLATLSPDDIGAAIEALIARLDTLQGDIDLEDDDPAGDVLDKGELDEARGLDTPRYGINQTRGPLNELQANEAYILRQECRA